MIAIFYIQIFKYKLIFYIMFVFLFHLLLKLKDFLLINIIFL